MPTLREFLNVRALVLISKVSLLWQATLAETAKVALRGYYLLSKPMLILIQGIGYSLKSSGKYKNE